MQVVKLWREDLAHINPKAAESLADPAQYPNLFPNLDLALHAEQYQVQLLGVLCLRGHVVFSEKSKLGLGYKPLLSGPHGNTTVLCTSLIYCLRLRDRAGHSSSQSPRALT